jgi:hypothetical protein
MRFRSWGMRRRRIRRSALLLLLLPSEGLLLLPVLLRQTKPHSQLLHQDRNCSLPMLCQVMP